MRTPYKMKGSPMQRNFGINAESPVKQAGLVKLAVKYGKKAYKAIKGSSKSTSKSTGKSTSKTTHVKHDPKSGHLRFQTNRTAQGGKPTGDYIAVTGKATGKPGGLKPDLTRKTSVKADTWDVMDKIVKGYTGK